MSTQANSIESTLIQGTSTGYSRLGAWLSYLYFTRFSILLWLSMALFVILDLTPATSITRGLLSIERWWQFLFAGLIIVVSGWTALLAARIVCAYGQERFGIRPPRKLRIGTAMSIGTFIAAQGPGAILLAWILYRSVTESDGQVSIWQAALSITVGILLATVAWYLVAMYYYWSYESISFLANKTSSSDDPREAKAFVAPEISFLNFEALQHAPPPPFARALAGLYRSLAGYVLKGPGYLENRKQGRPLHSGHAIAIVSMLSLSIFYAVLLPLTAPVPLARIKWFLRILLIVLIAVWWVSTWREHKKAGNAEWWNKLSWSRKTVLAFPLALFVIAPICVLFFPPLLTFPVIGSVYVLLMFACWGLTGLAFFLDRHRVPVLLFLCLFVFAENMIGDFSTWAKGHDGWRYLSLAIPEESDHYFAASMQTVSCSPSSDCLQTPKQVWESRSHNGNGRLIVVTASGGGIHAAVWTTRILSTLAREFAAKGESFDDSILLVSTVSGGSVGALSWIQEYFRKHDDVLPATGSDKALPWTVAASGCSSLEAVAWGLLYPDVFRAFYPFRHFLVSDLHNYDRGWAIQQAFERNVISGCLSDRGWKPSSAHDQDGSITTILSLAADLKNGKRIPAIAFNTTTAEKGDRFLLANYRLPDVPSEEVNNEVTPAASISVAYAQTKRDPNAKLADISLSTAARLSAAFPYVSPMPRISEEVSSAGFHFGDGGYFDNDGTATAIEFLRAALSKGDSKTQSSNTLRNVLMIEIRDGPDPYATDAPDSLESQKAALTWGSQRQTFGPLMAFYQAGHTGITRRNRRELCLLKESVRSQATVQHVVFDFNPREHKQLELSPQPLSWHLTQKQKNELGEEADYESELAQRVAAWYANGTELFPAKNDCELLDTHLLKHPPK